MHRVMPTGDARPARRDAQDSCPACHAGLPQGARFCPSCGTRIEADRPDATERKVVTTLFSDLVGFTALGERNDPEDIDAALRGFYGLARALIERFGGRVEKYIGDAVVGLFGVPTAHEDDAERAVRAALELVAHLDELPHIGGEPVRVRCAVNTGPALVRLDARPETGESALVGDAVNTAARLLTEAPPMCVVAGQRTQALTERVIAYDALPPIAAKGKTAPIERWIALRPIARRGAAAEVDDSTPMIGREVELAVLSGLLDKAMAAGEPQCALVSGEAGIGKSRLVREFFRSIDARPGLIVAWRQGHCPAYGHGLTLWPLREIVSAHIGMTPDDDPARAERRLAKATAGLGLDERTAARLRPLAGLPAPPADREEYFSAWTAFFEALARSRPAVLVLEDLHWASESTLAFIDHFVHAASGVPLLLLATARPEFLDASPEAALLTDEAVRIDLRPLSRRESERLAAALPIAIEQPESSARIAERCGGNPLFAEELSHYLADGSGGGSDRASAAAGLETPSTVIALIAARLDALPADHKSVLADAAVAGEAFTLAAVAAAGDRTVDEVQRALVTMEGRGMVRRLDREQGDEPLFSFGHALVRDVAYEQIVREGRALRHANLAWWMERTQAGQGLWSQGVLADQYATALEYAMASGRSLLAKALREPAIRHLLLVGDQMYVLDVTAAERQYRRAVALSPPGTTAHATALLRWGEALMEAGNIQKARKVLKDSADSLLQLGRRRSAAVAMTRLAMVSGLLGERDGRSVCETARSLIEAEGDSVELVSVLVECAAMHAFGTETKRAITVADDALAMARRLDMPLPARALHIRGLCRFALGDHSAFDDYRRALSLAREQGQGRETAALYHNLAEDLLLVEGPAAAEAVRREGLEFARLRHDETALGYLTNGLVVDRFWLGEWDGALDAGARQPDLLRSQGNRLDLAYLAVVTSLVHGLRGDTGECLRILAWADELDLHGLETDACFTLLPYLAASRLAAGDARSAGLLLQMLVERAGREGSPLTIALPLALRTALATTGVGLADAILAHATTPSTFRAHAATAATALTREARGEYAAAAAAHAAAAAGWAALRVPFERANALLGQARCLAAAGEDADARSPLETARTIFAELRAAPSLGEADAVLQRLRSLPRRAAPD